jgi:hypothetical protein
VKRLTVLLAVLAVTLASAKVTLPAVEKIDFNYGFLDPERRIALLRIDGMSSFREHFEFMRARGAPWIMQHANQVYRRYHGRAAPDNPDEVLAGIPAAADVFRGASRLTTAARTPSVFASRVSPAAAGAIATVLQSNQINRYTLQPPDALNTVYKHRMEVYETNMRWLASNMPNDATGCLECADKVSFRAQTILV